MPGEPDDLRRCEESGIGCRAGGFHIDPWKPVPLADMTDPLRDHARPGRRLCAESCVPLLAQMALAGGLDA